MFFTDEDCLCLKWDNCLWSKDDINRANDIAKDSEEYKTIKQKIHHNTCGARPEDYMVYCCGSDQRPHEDMMMNGNPKNGMQNI